MERRTVPQRSANTQEWSALRARGGDSHKGKLVRLAQPRATRASFPDQARMLDFIPVNHRGVQTKERHGSLAGQTLRSK